MQPEPGHGPSPVLELLTQRPDKLKTSLTGCCLKLHYGECTPGVNATQEHRQEVDSRLEGTEPR